MQLTLQHTRELFFFRYVNLRFLTLDHLIALKQQGIFLVIGK